MKIDDLTLEVKVKIKISLIDTIKLRLLGVNNRSLKINKIGEVSEITFDVKEE